MSTFKARLSRTSDYPRLVRLCRRAVGPGDYVLDYLRELTRRHELFLAFQKSELIGMTHFEECIDGSGWLSKARTDPDWRRQGVAVFLQEKIANYARKNGIRTLRLWVLSTNRPGIGAWIKGGFKPITEIVHVSQTLGPHHTSRKTRGLTRFPKQLVNSVLASSYISRLNGYMPFGWHIVKPNPGVLRNAAREGNLYLANETAFVLYIPDYAALDSQRRQHTEFTLLQGPPDESFRVVKEIAQSIGVRVLGAYLPRDKQLLSIARQSGFRIDAWGDYGIVTEKQLR